MKLFNIISLPYGTIRHFRLSFNGPAHFAADLPSKDREGIAFHQLKPQGKGRLQPGNHTGGRENEVGKPAHVFVKKRGKRGFVFFAPVLPTLGLPKPVPSAPRFDLAAGVRGGERPVKCRHYIHFRRQTVGRRRCADGQKKER